MAKALNQNKCKKNHKHAHTYFHHDLNEETKENLKNR